jgi:hypothetical protein
LETSKNYVTENYVEKLKCSSCGNRTYFIIYVKQSKELGYYYVDQKKIICEKCKSVVKQY